MRVAASAVGGTRRAAPSGDEDGGDGDGEGDGDGDGYGDITANLMVLVMARAMMMVTTVVIHTRQKSQHCNLIIFPSHRKKVTTL